MKKENKSRNPVVVAMNKRYGAVDTVMRDRRLRRPDDFQNSWEAEMDDDGPILPCHPDACETCHGIDWDIANDVPCGDKSWCQEYKKSSKGYDVCSLEKNHEGKHKSGSIEW